MKKISIYTILLAITLVSIQACGPSEEEQRAAEQARLDSLQQVEQQRIAAQMQAREDSLARIEEQKRLAEEAKPKFVEGGTYAVQVGAFRSEDKATSYKNTLSGRDYPHVYVIRSGNEETGHVWFRLRVGFFGSKAEAEKLGTELAEELNTGYWVSKVQRTGSNS